MSSPASPSLQEDCSVSRLSTSLLKAESEGEVKIGVDEMLQRHAGEFGRWQLRHFVLVNLAWALEAFHTMVMIFADREPAWRCTAPGCSPQAESVCGLPPGTWEWIGGPAMSTVSEWGLFCGHKYRVGLVQSAFFAGSMIGAGVFGHLSDTFLGRKGSLTLVCALILIFGCLTAASPSYWAYLLLRFLTGFGIGGVGLCSFVLSTETIGPSKRGIAGMSTFYFFSGGISILALIAYAFPSWRALYIVSSIPSLLFLLFVLPFVSESPRWYLIHGNLLKAMQVMHDIAKWNKKHIPNVFILSLDDTNSNKSEDQCMSSSVVDVIRSPITRTRLILSVMANFLTAITYYGLSLNVVNLGTNLYLNVALNAIGEMPAFALTAVLIELLGRRPLTIGTMWFSGVFCITGSILKGIGVSKATQMVCGILGIFGMAGTFNLLFIYIAELFPTVVRNTALGCCTQAGQIGAILAPMVVALGGGVPFGVFGGCGILGGFLAYFLPETLNQPLYDTFAGMEKDEKKEMEHTKP